MRIRVPKLAKITGGTFWMGSRSGEYSSETPCHEVVVGDFYLGICPVTEDEFQDFLAGKQETPGTLEVDVDHNPEGRCPANDISWVEAVDYCDWLARVSGEAFRLPSEAEWEYAARGGKELVYPTASGAISASLANYGNPTGGVTPVMRFPPNPFGLYDMAGNVWEWCSSKKGDYSGGVCTRSYDYPYKATDGREDTARTGASRVLRGGCYSNQAIHCRSAARYREFEWMSSNYHPSRGKNSFGFRVARGSRPPPRTEYRDLQSKRSLSAHSSGNPSAGEFLPIEALKRMQRLTFTDWRDGGPAIE